MTESGILAEGSVNGFVRGKFFNRCTRLHQLIATTFEEMLFERFLNEVGNSEYDELLERIRDLTCDDAPTISTFLSDDFGDNDVLKELMKEYEEFFQRVINGQLGSTAAYWAIYVYMVNRLYREIQRAVRSNNVRLYIQVLPKVIEIFFC